MANKKLRNTATGMALGSGVGVVAKIAIGGIGIAAMGTAVGVGIGGFVLAGAVLGGLAGAAATNADKKK